MTDSEPRESCISRIVSKEEATDIALGEALRKLPGGDCKGEPARASKVTDHLQGGIYRTWVEQSVWYVYLPWFDGVLALRSSRVIVVSKIGGHVLYDGSAGDEG